jgi:3-mercaptopyruvate sulfurtransferase SseA
VALQLRRHGIKNVRPLLGGYHAWKDLGYPLEQVSAETEPTTSDESWAAEDIA